MLAGAVFAVTADDTGEQVETITTEMRMCWHHYWLIKQAYTFKKLSPNRL